MSNIKASDFFPELSPKERAIEDSFAADETARFDRYTDDVLVGR